MSFIGNKISLFLAAVLIVVAGCSKDDLKENPRSSNKLTLGASAGDLLNDDKFTAMKIEIVSMAGYEPSPTALGNLESFLQAHVNKPGGIRLTERIINASGKTSYSISEIRDIEDNNRTAFSTEDEIAVFILFADGKSTSEEKDKMILGTAYRNTSMVIYEKTIRDFASSSTVSRSEIESTTLKHEFGHLFGLVDNGSPAQSEHEDPESKSHCNSGSCLMVATVEFGSGSIKLLKSRSQESIVFDEKCLEDLRANGGK